MMITTIKNQANIETPTTLTGYLVDGNKSVPLATGNRTYQEVQRAINGTDEYEGNAIVPEEAYPASDLALYIEQAQNKCDEDCKAYIYSYWSKEAQSNVTLGLYSQSISELCKTEISAVLSDNINHITALGAKTTLDELNQYMSSLTRVVMTGGN